MRNEKFHIKKEQQYIIAHSKQEAIVYESVELITAKVRKCSHDVAEF